MLNELYQNLDPVAFTIGPLSVRWYGIAYILGFLFTALIMWRLSKRWKISVDEDALFTILLCVIVGVIVGARVGYCLMYGNGYYLSHPIEILFINQGGMSFHGGLAGALAGGAVAAKLTGIPFLTLADMGAIAAPVGLFLGRCANFINGELWGAVTDAPWGVVFGGAAGMMPRHPSQLYEAFLEGIVLFCILFALSRKTPPRPRGTFIGVFLIFYGLFRFLIEFVRQPDAHIGYLYGDWLTMGQVLSVPVMVVGVVVLVFAFRKNMPQKGIPTSSKR
ncbi:MAG: prolipoprotein diacylglyceryl transferase [Eggerthellaceae bacterium]|nr:prolipoprotein diacylglyceryl transferase [Eggerthellaceae bacterium]